MEQNQTDDVEYRIVIERGGVEIHGCTVVVPTAEESVAYAAFDLTCAAAGVDDSTVIKLWRFRRPTLTVGAQLELLKVGKRGVTAASMTNAEAM